MTKDSTIEAKYAYRGGTFAAWLRAWLIRNTQARTPITQLIREYVEKTGKSISPRGAQKAARELEATGAIQIERHDCLWLLPMVGFEEKRTKSVPDSMVGLSVGALRSLVVPRMHSSHHYMFTFKYLGEQPIAGALRTRPWGRYGTGLQAIFRPSHRISISTFAHSLIVWVHLPKGQRTQEQRAHARASAQEAAASFAQEHAIRLLDGLKDPKASHHVVEQKLINEGLKPLFAVHGEAITERTGTKHGDESHPGKLEHEGKRRHDRVVAGGDIAEGFEFAFLDLKPTLSREFEENAARLAALERAMDERAMEQQQIIKNLTVLVAAEQRRQEQQNGG